MTRFLVADAVNFQLWPKFTLLQALHGCCTVIAVLLFASGSIFAADSPIIAPGANLEMLGEDYSFTYGPAVDRDGNVFFTDQRMTAS